MFGLFKKKKKAPEYIVASVNARLQPMHRGEIFEDSLDEFLKKSNFGEVSGGGTLQSKTGEIEHCDIEIEVKETNDELVSTILEKLESLGAPKGSKLTVESKNLEIPFGKFEGLAIYLNGSELADNVYEECDSNFVYEELDRLTEGHGRVYSYWQGNTETAFYLYGQSYQQMKDSIKELVENYPLCQKCRIEQIS